VFPQLKIKMTEVRWTWWSCDWSYFIHPFVVIDIIEYILRWLWLKYARTLLCIHSLTANM